MGNQNIHKRKTKTPIIGTTKTLTKRTIKTLTKETTRSLIKGTIKTRQKTKKPKQ